MVFRRTPDTFAAVHRPTRGFGFWFARVCAFIGLAALLAFTLKVTSKDDATNTETALWTFILFMIGLAVSYYFGKQSVEQAAADLVRPQARSAARRLVTLGQGIRTLELVVERQRQAAAEAAATNHGNVGLDRVDLALDMLLTYSSLQLLTVNDALEDWRQFDPAIVNDLEKEADRKKRADSEAEEPA
jgi:hypothetical protein